MLEVGCLVLGFFYLILGIFPKLTSDIINKSLKTFEIFLKKGYKVRPRDKSGALIMALELSSSNTDRAIEK